MIYSLIMIFLGTIFVFSGIMKIFYFSFFVDLWEEFGYSKWSLFPIGFMELMGSFALFAGIIIPAVAFLGAVLLSFIMFGALFAHLVSARQHWHHALPAIGCLVLLVLVMLITY